MSLPYAEYRQHTVTSSVVEPIDAPRVFAKELLPLRLTCLQGKKRQGFDPFFQGSRQGANRPVTSKHHALPAEAFDDVFNKWAQVFRRPVRRVSVSHQTGDLAGDIGETGNFPNVCTPGIQGSFLDRRDAAVVQNESDARALPRQIDSDRQLAG